MGRCANDSRLYSRRPAELLHVLRLPHLNGVERMGGGVHPETRTRETPGLKSVIGDANHPRVRGRQQQVSCFDIQRWDESVTLDHAP